MAFDDDWHRPTSLPLLCGHIPTCHFVALSASLVFRPTGLPVYTPEIIHQAESVFGKRTYLLYRMERTCVWYLPILCGIEVYLASLPQPWAALILACRQARAILVFVVFVHQDEALVGLHIKDAIGELFLAYDLQSVQKGFDCV